MWAAFDGFVLTDELLETFPVETTAGLPDLRPYFQLRTPIPASTTDVLVADGEGNNPRVERRALQPREGGPASRVADLAAYKGGKSWCGSRVVAPELMVPGVLWDIVGVQYGTCTEEFNYILDALFSEKGFNIPLVKPYWGGLYATRSQNSPSTGRMHYQLSNGSSIEARSWDQDDALKGKQRDGYLYAEAYQFRGIYCYVTIKQNLDVRNGKAGFFTTPDHVWVETLEELGRSKKEEHRRWHCIAGVHRSQNPWTFDSTEMASDKGIMTKEQHAIAYEGKTGQYVGSCFNYRRGERHFTTRTHPNLWADPNGPSTPENLRVPSNIKVLGGADTGNYYAAGFIGFDADGTAYVLYEVTNYHYTAGQIERDEWMDMLQWYHRIRHAATVLGGRPAMLADRNAQFKYDAHSHGVTLLPGVDPETRTEIARAYFQHDKIFFAPWLENLPYEVEKAVFPPEETSSGAWRREKKDDHCVDWMEHILANRGMGKPATEADRGMFRDTFMAERNATMRNYQEKNPWV